MSTTYHAWRRTFVVLDRRDGRWLFCRWIEVRRDPSLHGYTHWRLAP
jgi:hypothetical protein